MKLTVGVPDFHDLVRGVDGSIATASTEAMRETMPATKQALRDQTVALGPKVNNAWRGDVYPQRGVSIDAAGYVRTKAPKIIDAFARGATIVPVNGSKYLAIPTDAVPRTPGRKRSRMTPAQVEATFNQDLIIRPGPDGRLYGLIDPSKTGGKRVRRARGEKRSLVLMFTFDPSVRMPQIPLDLQGPGDAWRTAYLAALKEKLPR